MKKLILTITIIGLIGCNGVQKQELPKDIDSTSRIKLVHWVIINQRHYSIIEVDGIEYIKVPDGGVVRHTPFKCDSL